MRCLKIICFSLLALILSLNITSCSDTDESDDWMGLAGTAWTVLEVDDDSDYSYITYEYFLGSTICFGADMEGYILGEEYIHFDYSEQGGVSILIDNLPYYIKGSFSRTGSSATYTYHWSNESTLYSHTMILSRR